MSPPLAPASPPASVPLGARTGPLAELRVMTPLFSPARPPSLDGASPVRWTGPVTDASAVQRSTALAMEKPVSLLLARLPASGRRRCPPPGSFP